MDSQVPQPIGLAGIAPQAGSGTGGPQRRPPAAAGAGRPRGAAGGEESSPERPQPALPFEEALAELERIVRDLEGGELGLEPALLLYERGVSLVRECSAQLDAAEARVKVLSLDEEGRPLLLPLEEDGA